jgi:hypothetical protein
MLPEVGHHVQPVKAGYDDDREGVHQRPLAKEGKPIENLPKKASQ